MREERGSDKVGAETGSQPCFWMEDETGRKQLVTAPGSLVLWALFQYLTPDLLLIKIIYTNASNI